MHLVTIQGTHYAKWTQQEFVYLKSLVDSHCDKQHTLVEPADQGNSDETEPKKLPTYVTNRRVNDDASRLKRVFDDAVLKL